MYVPRAMYSFRMSFCTVPESFSQIRALLLRDGDVQRQQNRGGGVDRHRGRDALERNAVEQRFHVFERIDRHADLAHFAGRARMIGIEADLRGQIERDR